MKTGSNLDSLTTRVPNADEATASPLTVQVNLQFERLQALILDHDNEPARREPSGRSIYADQQDTVGRSRHGEPRSHAEQGRQESVDRRM